MIFVTLGTQDKPFTRLLDAIEHSNIDDRIIAQVGFTDYHSEKMEIHKYLDKDEFERNIAEADVVISHAGVGSIMQALKLKKKVIACPRLSKYGEHQNDHQLQITEPFYEKGYILRYLDGDDIDEIYKKAKDFVPREYKTNNENFVKKLEEYLGI